MDKKLRELYDKLDEYEIKTVKWLRRTRPPLYTVLRHVSNSGMLRVIDVFAYQQRQASVSYSTGRKTCWI